MHLIRKIGLLVGLALLTTLTPASANATYTVENGLIKLTTPAYTIAFSSTNGGIVSLIDSATQQTISDGSVNGDLWSAKLDNTHSVGSSSEQFSYAWADGTLTLTYSGDLDVQVTVNAGDQAIKLQASVSQSYWSQYRRFRPAGAA